MGTSGQPNGSTAAVIDTPRTEPSELRFRMVDSGLAVVENGVDRPQAPPSATPARDRAYEIAKATLDVVFALLAILALAPLLLVIALLVKIDSPGPVLFRQRRLGRDMRPFTMLKFRTMHSGVSPDRHRQFIAELANGGSNGDTSELKKLTNDPRVTPLGRFLRTTSIDEFPQLLNVLTLRMSLVGPRPALGYELEHYSDHHFTRFAVRPGLTGLWQVSGRSRLGFQEMLDLDAHYARGASFYSDLRILALTPRAAIGRTA